MDSPLYLIAEFDELTSARISEVHAALSDAGFADRQTKGIHPHITLGICDPAGETALPSLIREACRKVGPFQVIFGSLGLFGGEVLFWSPAPSAELLSLRRGLGGVLMEEGYAWIPHATLLITDQGEASRAIPLAVSLSRLPAAARVTGVGLYKPEPFRLVYKYEFQAACAGDHSERTGMF